MKHKTWVFILMGLLLFLGGPQAFSQDTVMGMNIQRYNPDNVDDMRCYELSQEEVDVEKELVSTKAMAEELEAYVDYLMDVVYDDWYSHSEAERISLEIDLDRAMQEAATWGAFADAIEDYLDTVKGALFDCG